jgi:hypothetical membrane protein
VRAEPPTLDVQRGTRFVRCLALGGLAGPIVFVFLVVLCGALRPDYSHVTQLMSELGESGSSHASLMNFFGFVSSGVLLAAFGVSLTYALPRTTSSLAAAGLIVVYGLGVVGAGLYSCDRGCPSQNLSPEATMHRVFSLTAFVAAILGIALWAYEFRSLAAWRSLWRYSAVTSAVALVLFFLVGTSERSRTFAGVWQRLFLATLDLWSAVVGLRAFRLRGVPWSP